MLNNVLLKIQIDADKPDFVLRLMAPTLKSSVLTARTQPATQKRATHTVRARDKIAISMQGLSK